MSTTLELKVTGMTCGHCEMHVKEALESVPGVVKAQADRNKNSATVVLNNPSVNTDDLIKAVQETGYEASV
jgi:copper chaperone